MNEGKKAREGRLGSDVASLAEERVGIAETVEPRVERRQRADDLQAVYRETYLALEPLFSQMGDGAPEGPSDRT